MLDVLYAGFTTLPDGEVLCGSVQAELTRIGQVGWYTSGFE